MSRLGKVAGPDHGGGERRGGKKESGRYHWNGRGELEQARRGGRGGEKKKSNESGVIVHKRARIEKNTSSGGTLRRRLALETRTTSSLLSTKAKLKKRERGVAINASQKR